MNKEYLMFIDSRGCYNDGKENNFSMVGVIFENDYCTNSSVVDSELTHNLKMFNKEIINSKGLNDTDSNNIQFHENVFLSSATQIEDKIIWALPEFLNNLKFWIVSTSIKQDEYKSKDLYELAANNLIKRFYSFIITKKAKSGGIIVQSGYSNSNDYVMPQKFFNIYNEREYNFDVYHDINKKINKFIISQAQSREYNGGFEVSKTINSLLLSMLGFANKENFNIQYEYMNKLLNIFEKKTYKEELDLLNESTQKYIKNTLNKYTKESKELKNQLSMKNNKIIQREKEISELTKEINLLKQELHTAIINRKSEAVISSVLSQVDMKIKGIEKQILLNAQN